RSKENFPIGHEKMPIEMIKAFAITKKSAALANNELGLLEKEKADAIGYAADEILNDHLTEHFPLVTWQTGSGTQSNMNVRSEKNTSELQSRLDHACRLLLDQ